MNESDIIALFYRDENRHSSSGANEEFDRLDDCAALPFTACGDPSKDKILMTTDSMIEMTHFRRDWSSPSDLASRLFHCNLSDLAISGGKPEFALLNLGLPPDTSDSFIQEFAQTLRQELADANCRLIGGDTFRSSIVNLTLTLGGRARRHLTRHGARKGDHLYLSGTVGLALAGYKILKGELDLPDSAEASLRQEAIERHLRPRARHQWASQITSDLRIRAGMDLSDGLLQDSCRLARASDATIEIDLDYIPIHPGLSTYMEHRTALYSGEELELLFIGEPGLQLPFPCRAIGRVVSQEDRSAGKVILLEKGEEIVSPKGGYHHF